MTESLLNPAESGTPIDSGRPVRHPVSRHRDSVWLEIWERRELLRQLINRDVRLRYHQAVMGFLWALLMPCLVLGASVMIRGLISRNGNLPHSTGVAGIAFKAWAWSFFVGSINFSTNSLLSNINLISKMYFPREVLPIAAVGAQGVDALVGLGFLAVLSPLLGVHYSLALLWLPVLLVILLLLVLGLALLLSAANVFYRDVKYLVQVAVTFGIFATPVFYGLPDLGQKERLIIGLNPLTTVLEGLRLVVGEGVGLAHTIPAPNGGMPIWSPWFLVGSTVAGVLMFAIGARFFRLQADRFAELA